MAEPKLAEQAELDRMSTALYAELRRMAARHLRLERQGHTLQPTALVHEVYLRLAQCDADMGQRSRAHFLALAATLMRQILVNHARTRKAFKRGGGALKVTLEEYSAVSSDGTFEVIAVDDALGRLAKSEERKSRAIELKFFGGLTEDEIAEAMGISKSTVSREVRLGLALLYRLMRSEEAAGE